MSLVSEILFTMIPSMFAFAFWSNSLELLKIFFVVFPPSAIKITPVHILESTAASVTSVIGGVSKIIFEN